MSDVPGIPQRNTFRIPNLPMGQIVDTDGKATDDELTFRQGLLTLLENLIGNEGLVMPKQTATNITAIQNHTQTTPGASPASNFTLAPGTFIYNSTNDTVQVSVLVAGTPTFKTVTVT